MLLNMCAVLESLNPFPFMCLQCPAQILAFRERDQVNLFSFQWDFAQVDALWIYCEVVTKHLQRVVALRLFSSFLFSFFFFFFFSLRREQKMVTLLSSNYSSFRETCLICLLSSVLCQVGFDQTRSCQHSVVSIHSKLVTSELWSVIWSRSHCSSSFSLYWFPFSSSLLPWSLTACFLVLLFHSFSEWISMSHDLK